jgi:hypothetical protein
MSIQFYLNYNTYIEYVCIIMQCGENEFEQIKRDLEKQCKDIELSKFIKSYQHNTELICNRFREIRELGNFPTGIREYCGTISIDRAVTGCDSPQILLKVIDAIESITIISLSQWRKRVRRLIEPDHSKLIARTIVNICDIVTQIASKYPELEERLDSIQADVNELRSKV